MEITLRILCLLVGYLLGSFLTAECIARRLTGRSARDLGSGNPGMANIMATLGKGPGFAVLAGDVAKTVLACGLCWLAGGLAVLGLGYLPLGAVLIPTLAVPIAWVQYGPESGIILLLAAAMMFWRHKNGLHRIFLGQEKQFFRPKS